MSLLEMIGCYVSIAVLTAPEATTPPVGTNLFDIPLPALIYLVQIVSQLIRQLSTYRSVPRECIGKSRCATAGPPAIHHTGP
jgi:hypothetical protein